MKYSQTLEEITHDNSLNETEINTKGERYERPTKLQTRFLRLKRVSACPLVNKIISLLTLMLSLNFPIALELSFNFLLTFAGLPRTPEMDGEHKDYLYKNEISLSIGDDSIDSSVSTPSTGER